MRSPVTGTTARGMVKGIVAAASAAESAAGRGAGTATLLEAAGSAWAAKAGGASGALWGAALAALGARLGDSTPTITAEDVVAALRNALEAIGTLGKSEPGDKTMLDALDPFISALAGHVSGGADLADAWERSAATAVAAAEATAALTPRVGRARPLAERSIGTPDPGAVSLALCLTVAGRALHTRPQNT